MLSDTKLQAIRRNPKTDKVIKVTDKDGLYVRVTPRGTVSFKFDFWIGGAKGRRGTVTFGQYPMLSLADARKKLLEAKADLAKGIDPARKKAARLKTFKNAGTFGEWWFSYLKHADLADSTIAMRQSIYDRDLKRTFGKLKLSDIDAPTLRRLCDKIVERGAPAVAVHVREIVLQVFNWAKSRGEKVVNPATEVPPKSIAKFKPRERNLSREELRLAAAMFDHVGANLSVKAGAKLLLLTFVRKSELSNATWDEIDFVNSTWTIPPGRMKKRTPHLVPLSNQALDLLVALRSLAGVSDFILPGRYDSTKPMSAATFNRFFTQLSEAAEKHGQTLDPFAPHDLRRTASTMLHEAGYPADWIEKQLAHEQRGVRAVYNKAEYLDQRREMMQAWSDMVDEIVNTNA